MGNDFYDFYDTLIFALLRKKFWQKQKNRQICWKNRQKRLALRARVRIFVQNSEGDRARPEIARKGTTF